MHDLQAIYLDENGRTIENDTRLKFDQLPRIGEKILLSVENALPRAGHEDGQWLFRVTDICHHVDKHDKGRPGSITLTADPSQSGF